MIALELLQLPQVEAQTPPTNGYHPELDVPATHYPVGEEPVLEGRQPDSMAASPNGRTEEEAAPPGPEVKECPRCKGEPSPRTGFCEQCWWAVKDAHTLLGFEGGRGPCPAHYGDIVLFADGHFEATCEFAEEAPWENLANHLLKGDRNHRRHRTEPGFTQLPNLVLMCPGLTPTERLLYMTLQSFDWERSGKRKGVVWPKRWTLAALLNRSEKQTQRLLQSLARKGLIVLSGKGNPNKWFVPLADVPWHQLYHQTEEGYPGGGWFDACGFRECAGLDRKKGH